jgi:hypothetical protein
VGLAVGCGVGLAVGCGVGLAVGCGVGLAVGCGVGLAVGCGVGLAATGDAVGAAVGAALATVDAVTLATAEGTADELPDGGTTAALELDGTGVAPGWMVTVGVGDSADEAAGEPELDGLSGASDARGDGSGLWRSLGGVRMPPFPSRRTPTKMSAKTAMMMPTHHLEAGSSM